MFEPISFYKECAIHHKEILHTEEKPAFFREFSTAKILFDNSDFLVRMRKANETILVAEFNGDGAIISKNLDQKAREYYGAVFLLEKVKVTDYDGIEAARKKLIEIWEDIDALTISKIRKGEIIAFDYRTKITSIGQIADSYYGISIFVSYTQGYCPKYNPEKWT